jgi:hypothetical protein
MHLALLWAPGATTFINFLLKYHLLIILCLKIKVSMCKKAA